ncbi:unnamed protein product, partial [Oncorhynchus mykiss]
QSSADLCYTFNRFLLFTCLGLLTIISYRLSQFPPQLQRLIGVLIFLPTLNPIIYCLKTNQSKSN